MTTKNTGGSAFPASEEYWGSDCAGMTLRDWFAGQALAGLLASGIAAERGQSKIELAEIAYLNADAMIAARGAAE